jgi:hypothetical protein
LRSAIYTIVHTLYAFIAAMTVGAVLNVALLFTCSFLFAGANSDRWIAFYFGNDGLYFMSSVLLVACCVYPFTRKLNIVKRS